MHYCCDIPSKLISKSNSCLHITYFAVAQSYWNSTHITTSILPWFVQNDQTIASLQWVLRQTRFREFLPKNWVSEGYLRLLKGFVRFVISASLTMIFWNLICCFHLLFGSVVLLDTSIVSASLLVYSHLKKLASWGGLKYLALMIRYL